MNIRSLFALSALSLALAACSGDDSGTESEATTATTTSPTTTTDTSSTTDTTTDSTTDTTTDSTTTSSTTDATESTGETSTTTTTGGAELSCDAYCDLYLGACGDFSEYDNKESCMAQCAQWPEGTLDATSGDSLGCRIYHATVAESTDANIHCPHAGPSGGAAADDAVCVDDGAPACADYCSTYFQNCKDGNDVYEGDEAACMDACKMWYAGTDADTAGDTIGCRTYHAGAALGDPVTHCPHASPSGGGVCTVG